MPHAATGKVEPHPWLVREMPLAPIDGEVEIRLNGKVRDEKH